MHTRMFRALGAVGVLGASLALASPAFAANPVLYVNGTTGSDAGPNTCRLSGHPCATIHHAVEVAPGAATIKVAAGTYDEQVLVTGKNLTISGAGIGKTIIRPTSLSVSSTTDPNHAGVAQSDIVAFTDAKSGGVKGVTVDGSAAPETNCDANYVGVYFDDASGTLSSDAINNVEHDQGTFGCQAGANGGVYVANDDATTGTSGSYTVKMTTVTVNGYTKDGITCRDLDTNCSIKGSKVTGIGATGLTAQNGIELYGITGGSVSGTTVTANSYTSPGFTLDNGNYATGSGILAINVSDLSLTGDHVNNNDENIVGIEDPSYAGFSTQGTWTISKNTVASGTNDTGQGTTVAVPQGDGVGDGIDLENVGAATLYGNTVTKNAEWGIALYGADGTTIGGTGSGQRNTITSNGDDGIWLGEYAQNVPSTNNAVTNNLVKGNKNDGILAAGADSSNAQQAINNTFDTNLLEGNLHYDAEDNSSGTGTSGTANNWTGNVCMPASDSNPSGLCS